MIKHKWSEEQYSTKYSSIYGSIRLEKECICLNCGDVKRRLMGFNEGYCRTEFCEEFILKSVIC